MLTALTLTLSAKTLVQSLGAAILIGFVGWLLISKKPNGQQDSPSTPEKAVPPARDQNESEPDTSVYEGPEAVAQAWVSILFLEGWAKHHNHTKVLNPLANVRRDLFVPDTKEHEDPS